MTVLLVNPNTSDATTATMVEIARDAAPADVAIEGATVRAGPALLTTPQALEEAAAHVLALLSERDLDRYRAVVVAAFGDPGRDEAARRYGLPVIGIAQAGMAEAAAGGRRFSVVTTTPRLVDAITARAHRYGHGTTFAGVRLTPGDPEPLMRDPRRLEDAMAEACRAAEREDGAQAIVIGGGPLARVARILRPLFRTPIIEPIPAAVRMALAAATPQN